MSLETEQLARHESSLGTRRVWDSSLSSEPISWAIISRPYVNCRAITERS